ncbi:FAD-dependent monooxygenase [Nocardiopsis sp. NPDC050513]|uniref:FAD-dependent monooxygenase n=1 Tax=Nocardiopsis sp. NPDC050513 TaxID=3364338 RepID=UPI00378CA9B3
MENTDVIVVGAGPNGLTLACELGLAGVRAVVLERLPGPGDEPKANGLLGQVVTMVDRRGLYGRLSGAEGSPAPLPAFVFAAMPLDLSLLAENPVLSLPVPQPRLVRVLADRAAELGADLRWGHAMVGLEQDGESVTAEVEGPDGPYRLRARHLVGADGGHSATRALSGIGFPGVSRDRTTTRTASVTVPDTWLDPATGGLNVPGHGTVPPFLGQRTENGGFTYAPLPGQPPLIVTVEWDRPGPEGPMSLAELRDSVRRVLGVDMPLGPPTGPGPHVLRRRTGGNDRHAERFRDGRVFLLGDAAHVDTAGGQGLNLGMQDAMNLGWKIAAGIRGDAPAGLLDTYDSERRPAAERVTVYARALNALLAPGGDVTALRELFGELLTDADCVRRVADLIAGTDIRYDMGGDDPHPLVGRCAPDMELHTREGPVRLAELTRTARPLLLDLTDGGVLAEALSGADERVDVVVASPGSGTPAATGLLLRPDCYVAWASSSPRPDRTEAAALRSAVHRWFGAPGGPVGEGPARLRVPAEACRGHR